MSKRFLSFCAAGVLACTVSVAVVAQETIVTKKTEVVQHADGSYTVIEYPVGKEVVVTLTPSGTITGATGAARVLRAADGTKVYLDLNNITGPTSSYYAYAVDPSGATTLLGPLTVTNGKATAEFSTPLTQFMLVLSPTQGLTAIDTTTPVVFRSALPTGYAVVPRVQTTDDKAVASAEPIASAYEVPLLNVPSFNGDDTEVRVKFDGELQGLDAKAYVDPEGSKTMVKMRFGDLRKVPAKKRFVLWAASPDGKYTKLGQIINTGSRDEAEIRSETALRDFGLFLTVEDSDVNVPTSRVYSVFARP